MQHIVFQRSRPYRTICSVSGTWIEPDQPAWHEPKRNWHAHEDRGERLDVWIDMIDRGMREKPKVVVQPNIPPSLEKVANERQIVKKPFQQSLF